MIQLHLEQGCTLRPIARSVQRAEFDQPRVAAQRLEQSGHGAQEARAPAVAGGMDSASGPPTASD